MLHVSLEVNMACFAGMAVLAQTILVFIIIIIIITFLNEMIDNLLNAKTYVFHMSRLTDCDIREQRKWNKSFNEVPLSWCQRDFQKDEQDGKVFNQEVNVDTAGWRLPLMTCGFGTTLKLRFSKLQTFIWNFIWSPDDQCQRERPSESNLSCLFWIDKKLSFIYW